MRDNLQQKDGYKYMLDYMARRRRQHPDLDIESEEIKLMNGIKLLVESGWVVDRNYFIHLCEVAMIGHHVNSYKKARAAKQKVDPKSVCILRFVTKFAENLGMANIFGLDDSVRQPRQPNEVYFNLDPALYYSG